MIKLDGQVIEFGKFPNNETILKKIKQSYVHTLSFKYEDDSDLIKLMFVKNYLDSIHADVERLLIYQMPYSRMDRSEDGSPFTLKYVANFINQMNFQNVEVVEPHSDVTPALLNNATSKYINFDLIERVKKEIGFDEDNDYIMFPDAGASKRYSKMKANNVIIGNKKRDFATGKIEGLQLIGDLNKGKGSKVIIIDDLSSYGGTFVHSTKALWEEGFENVYLLVAHAENSIFKGELFDHVEKVFTTDSLLTEHTNWENQKFAHQLRVYELEGLV